MNLTYAVERLYDTGWTPSAESGLDKLPDGRLFPSVSAVQREFARAGLELRINQAPAFSCYRATWSNGTVIGACDRIPELGARFYERGPKRGHDKFVTFLDAAIERGLIEVDDVDLAAYQFTDLCLAGLFRQCIFSYRSKAPSQAEIDHVVRSGVHVFLKAYGTATLAAEEQASESV